jgi:membrane protein
LRPGRRRSPVRLRVLPGAGEPGGRSVGVLWSSLKRAVRRAWADNVLNLAGALSFFALLSLFPAILLAVGLLGLFGRASTVTTVQDLAGRFMPQGAVDALAGPVQHLVTSKGTAGALVSVGTLVAVASASTYVGVFMWAANVIYGAPEQRPFSRRLPRQVLIALAVIVLLAVAAVVLVASGPLLSAISQSLDIGSLGRLVFEIVKWPAFFVVATLVFDLLYYFGPNVHHRSFRWLTPGGLLGVVVWLVASVGFSFYAGRVGTYNATYGSLGGVILLLIWVWILNIGLLLGAEYDAQLERDRGVRRGTQRLHAAGHGDDRSSDP